MKKARFLTERRPAWQRFEKLLLSAESFRVPRLREEEVSEFSELFRSICYDLATIRSRDWGSGLERYLNDLVVRGHGAFYGSPPRRGGEVVRFFTEKFPRLLRQNIAYFWVSLTLFAAPFAISWILVESKPSLAARVLPGSILAQMDEMYSERDSDHPGMEAAAAGFYIHNNISIAFRCFALGILLGIGTIYVLVYNGIVLGTVSGYVLAMGHAERFLSFVVSHGSFELTAIVISGAAGLILGHALVAPGPLTRLQALHRRGLIAVQLALGAGGMLAVAALIEGFWSPSSAPPMAKYIVGGMLWLAVILYLAAAGRPAKSSKSRREPSPA
jgi:uncharacterized membrane protein SpoIIM required for sporulation